MKNMKAGYDLNRPYISFLFSDAGLVMYISDPWETFL